MADPITIVGTASAAASIIGVLGKTIIWIAELRSQWQDADLTVIALESQLRALTSALNNIKHWAQCSSADIQHPQLTMDLDRCLNCCRLLADKLFLELSQLHFTPENRLDGVSKLRFLPKTKDFEHIQRMIEQQTSVLALLLTTCNTNLLSEQRAFLEQSHIRKAVYKMEDDTASLIVHRDTSSLITSTTTSITSSKRSLVFAFDKELLTSGIYLKWIRGSVKKTLNNQQRDPPPPRTHPLADWPDRYYHTTHSQEPSDSLPGYSVAIFGHGSHDMVTKLNIEHVDRHAGARPLASSIPAIIKAVLYSAKWVVDTIRELGIASTTDRIWEEHSDCISGHSLPVLSSKCVTAINWISNSPYYLELLSRPEAMTPNSVKYFIAEISRISSGDYMPIKHDLAYSRMKEHDYKGVTESHTINPRGYHILNYRGDPGPDTINWIRVWCNVDSTVCIQVIDLEKFNSVENMVTSRRIFAEAASRTGRRGLSITMQLILYNTHNFGQQLDRLFLGTLCSDYQNGDSVDNAIKSVVKWFSSSAARSKVRFSIYKEGIEASAIKQEIKRLIKSKSEKMGLEYEGVL